MCIMNIGVRNKVNSEKKERTKSRININGTEVSCMLYDVQIVTNTNSKFQPLRLLEKVMNTFGLQAV